MKDSERLKLLWNERHKLSQREFGKRYGIGSGAMVSQYLLGKAPLNLAVVVKFAKGLGCKLEEISPSLALLAQSANALSSKVSETEGGGSQTKLPILSDDYLLSHT